jgi:hypothetical protein
MGCAPLRLLNILYLSKKKEITFSAQPSETMKGVPSDK